jgi:putative ABC transport system ATP-binding protein
LFDLQEMTGMTLILVTHDDALAARCTRQIRLRDGTVVEDTLRALISGSIGAKSKI